MPGFTAQLGGKAGIQSATKGLMSAAAISGTSQTI